MAERVMNVGEMQGTRASREIERLQQLLQLIRWSRDGAGGSDDDSCAGAPPVRLRYTQRVPEGNPLLGGSNARRSELLLGCRELWRHSGAHKQSARWHARAA